MGCHGMSKRDRHGKQMKRRDESSDFLSEEIKEYMTKRALKKALRAAKKLKTQSVSGYSNDTNPFGDSNLTEKFVWPKKIEKDIHRGASLDEFSVKAERRRRRETRAEVAKAKRRREEKALHEEDMSLLARERARAEFQDLEMEKEDFYFNQSKLRSEIRLREGRAKPIDVLYKHLDGSDDNDIELSEPYMVFEGLYVKDMVELHEDIKMNMEWDRATPTRVQYWEALNVVCNWELAKARERDRARVRGEELFASQERGIHADVEADVRKLLDGKTHNELVQLQLGIESKLCSGAAKVVEFWEAVLKHLDIYKAKACLKEIHREMSKSHLHRVEQTSNVQFNHVVEETEEEKANLAGSVSPEPVHSDDREEAMVPKPAPVEDNLELKAIKAMGAIEEGDTVFDCNAELNLESKVYQWHDKYRPVKPKYFNRVHTGYRWNKYNQTHYDHDNPPPKFVQGYKFNIFYPNLVGKIKDPPCTVEKDGTSAETCIIRFQAGPPYEDIAFRIVNKEWEYSRKKGYKYTFEHGILHLYFNFKRHVYRR